MEKLIGCATSSFRCRYRKGATPLSAASLARGLALLRPSACARATAGVAWLALGSVAIAADSSALPAGFVYLRDIDATIVQDIRYAGENNFTGRRVPGYEAGECVLRQSAAQALAKVQADLKADSLSLLVYDCYRPQQAVSAFVAWTRRRGEHAAGQRFHPRLTKAELLSQAYIAGSSTHSRGIAVDLGLVRLPVPEAGAFDADRAYAECAQDKEKRGPDAGLDFGTGFDCFDARSNTSTGGLSKEQREARSKLVAAMSKHGFANYKREWWHFTFAGAAGGSFDFPIVSRAPPSNVQPESRPAPAGP